MAISHADHDHPNTPAGRAACRKAAATVNAALVLGNPSNPPQITVVPRKRGDGGVVKGMKAARPPVDLKRPGTHLRTIGDLPDVPRMLAHGARMAWEKGWEVTIGEKFNDLEARIIIKGDLGEIAMVWKPSLPNGVWGIFFRPDGSSVTHRIDSVQRAFLIAAEDDDEWFE